jgi:hypothetical protein
LGGGHDEIATRQGRKVRDEGVLSHEVVQVDVYRQWHGGGARRDIHHLRGPNILKLLRIFHQGKACASFQDDQLVSPAARGFHDDGRTGDRDRHGTRLDAATAGILRDPQENRTVVYLGVMPGLVETENRVGAKARDSEIGEGKFRARFPSGPHTGVFAYAVIHYGRPRGCLRRQKLNIANDLRDPRLLFRIGGNELAGEQ